MISQNVLEALNTQLHVELESAYIYLAMAAHFEVESLPGFATWMRRQSQEEQAHAMRLYNHILDRGGRVRLRALNEPPSDFGSPLEAFTTALEHEREVTKAIHRLYHLVQQEDDFAAQVELHWFITEQVEEEKTAGDIVDKLKRAGDSDVALLYLDRELGQRGEE